MEKLTKIEMERQLDLKRNEEFKMKRDQEK